MKRFALALCLGLGALATNAQMNYKVQTACHPQDVKHYDTERLRSAFMRTKSWLRMKSTSRIPCMTV